MKRFRMVARLAVLVGGFAAPAMAHAEAGEITAGVQGAVMLPSFQARDTAALSVATWNVGATAQYGLLDDLFLQTRLNFSIFGAEVSETREYRGRELEGLMSFDATQVGVETGVRYNLFAGYDIAPYVEAGLGMMWVGYRDIEFLDDAGRSYGLETPDESDVGLTLSIGAHADVRIANLLLLGLGFRFTKVFSERYAYNFEIPLTAQFFF